MASFIIELIKSHCNGNRNQSLGHAYYYCQYSHKKDEGPAFLRWIIGQLSRQAKWAPRQLLQLRESGLDPTIPDLLSTLSTILERFDHVYLAVDGVDESEPRAQMLSVLTTLATDERFQKVRLLITSRLYHDIERAFSGISANISMSNYLVAQDISTVVHEWITTSAPMKMWSHLSPLIEEQLCWKAGGM